MLISSGASSKVLSQIPRPQTIVDLLEQEWWAGAAAPEGTEPGNPGLDEGHVRGRLSSAGPPPPGLCSSHRSRPALAVVLPPNHAMGCFPGMRMAVERWEEAFRPPARGPGASGEPEVWTS